jgi:broad specificity phosphatase PhoE
MKTKVYLIRHGETDSNATERFTGPELPLNARGMEQAKCLGAAMSKVHLDAIYASPLLRAYMTALQVQGDRNIPISKDDGLTEIDCGNWIGYNREEVEALWPGMMEIWQNQPDKLDIPGGETFKQAQDRAYDWFKGVIKLERGRTIAVASHMLTIQLLLGRMLGIPISEVWNMRRLDNTSVTVLDVYDDGDFEIVNWGDNSHLPDELKNSFVRIAGFVHKAYDATTYEACMEGRYNYLKS